MMNWLEDRRQTVQGYLDMGTIRIPPLPPYIVLTDRDDGTRWLLCYSLTIPDDDGLGYITITDSLPTTPDVQTYGPYDGPYLSARVRLMVRGGYLSMDVAPQVPGFTDDEMAPILARSGLAGDYRRIILPTGYSDTARTSGLDLLAWVDFATPPQTPNPT